MKKGIFTIEDLRERSTIDPLDRNPYDPCWHFTGSKSRDKTPRIHTLDHDRIEKRVMSGPKAVWNIAKGEGPGDKLVYRTCCCHDCVNPWHHALANDKAEIGAYIAQAGFRKGTAIESRRANARKGWAAQGITPASPAVVLACRAAPASVTSTALGLLHGLDRTTVSAIRRLKSHKHVVEEV